MLFKAKKKQRFYFSVIKLLLFAGVVWLVYSQLARLEAKKWDEFNLEKPWVFCLAVLMVYPNIYMVYLMWTRTLRAAEIPADIKLKYQSFFAGIVTGFLTPNMIGNFVGRIYYFDQEKRLPLTVLTLLSNYAQFITSLLFGLIAVVLMNGLLVHTESNWPLIILGTGVVLAILFYVFVEQIITIIRKRETILTTASILRAYPRLKWEYLGLSALRFLIFSTQFVLVLYSFGENISWAVIFGVWQVYLLTMMAPSLFLGKIGIKESIGLWVLTLLGINEVAIVFTSLLLWFVNTLSPALLGLIICRSKETL